MRSSVGLLFTSSCGSFAQFSDFYKPNIFLSELVQWFLQTEHIFKWVQSFIIRLFSSTKKLFAFLHLTGQLCQLWNAIQWHNFGLI